MKIERKITVLNILLELIMSIIMIYASKVLNSYTLLTIAYLAIIYLTFNIIAFTSSVLRGRRVSIKEPFGYGKKELLCYGSYGLLIVGISIYLVIKSFYLSYEFTDLRVLLVILGLYLMNFFWSNELYLESKNIESEMLMEEALLTYNLAKKIVVFVLFVILAGRFLIFDHIGVILVSVLIFFEGMKVIFNNYLVLKGENNQNRRIIKSIKKIINEYEGSEYIDVNLIKLNNFYKAEITISVYNYVDLNNLVNFKKAVSKKIRRKNKNIKFVDFLIKKKN